MQASLFKIGDGWCHGLLFACPVKRRPSLRAFISHGALRRKDIRMRTPAWADKSAIKAIYAECKRLTRRDGPRTWAVDHIIPLHHPWVCGLHVENNLEIVPWAVNQMKGNMWPIEAQLILEF
jgi:hypothetical protein